MAQIADVIIPALVLRVQGDLSIKPRFEWLDGAELTVNEGQAQVVTKLRVYNDNDVVMQFPEPSFSASNDMVSNAVLQLADVPANSYVDFTLTITLRVDPAKVHGEVVTLSFAAVTVTTVES